MGKGRNKKRVNNRARRDHDRSVRDSESERNNQHRGQPLNTSNRPIESIQAITEQELHQELRRLNNSNSLSSRGNGDINNNQQTPLQDGPSIDEVFNQVLGIVLEGLESYIQTMRTQHIGGEITTPSYHIDNLPTREVTVNDQGADGEATCHICQENVEVGTTVTWLPKCQHWFCTECLEPWLKEHNTCPTCREVIE